MFICSMLIMNLEDYRPKNMFTYSIITLLILLVILLVISYAAGIDLSTMTILNL